MNRATLAALAALVLLPAAARAADPELARLQEQIARARQESPKAFQQVRDARLLVPHLDRQRRGPLAVVAPLLTGLGPSALLPMLDELLGGARAPELTPTGHTAWAVGLLEAVAALEDPRGALPARRMLESEAEPQVVRAAAATLGSLGGEKALGPLAALALKPGPKRLPVVSGLAECRQLGAASLLAELLATRPEPPLARAAAKALGELASAWVWELPAFAGRADKDAIRSAAARALLAAFIAYRDGEVHTQAGTSLAIVAAPETRALIEAALKDPLADRAELERLAARLAR